MYSIAILDQGSFCQSKWRPWEFGDVYLILKRILYVEWKISAKFRVTELTDDWLNGFVCTANFIDSSDKEKTLINLKFMYLLCVLSGSN